MKTRLAFLVSVLFVTIIGQNCIHAQERNTEFKYILQIDDTPITRKEHRALMKAKDHQEYDVEVKKINANLAFTGDEGYRIYYFYKENNKLKSNWIERPDSTKYDQFNYTWEAGLFEWRFINSKTGKTSIPVTKKFD